MTLAALANHAPCACSYTERFIGTGPRSHAAGRAAPLDGDGGADSSQRRRCGPQSRKRGRPRPPPQSVGPARQPRGGHGHQGALTGEVQAGPHLLLACLTGTPAQSTTRPPGRGSREPQEEGNAHSAFWCSARAGLGAVRGAPPFRKPFPAPLTPGHSTGSPLAGCVYQRRALPAPAPAWRRSTPSNCQIKCIT